MSKLVVPIYVVLVFLRMLPSIQDPLYKVLVDSIFAVIGVCATVFFVRKINLRSYQFLLVYGLLTSSVLVWAFGVNYRYQDVVLIFSYLGFAICPIFVKLNRRVINGLNAICVAFLLNAMVLGVDPNEVFGVSRNFVSVMLFVTYGYHIIASYQHGVNPSLILLLVDFIICLWALGRAGIITFGLLLCILPAVTRLSKTQKYCLYFVLFGSVGWLFLVSGIEGQVSGLDRIFNEGLRDHRNTINADYVKTSVSSIGNFIFAPPVREVISIVEVDNNSHNSYINAHIFYGASGIIIIFGFLVYSVSQLIRQRSMMLLCLLICLLIRSWTDSVAFHGPLDPLILFVVFESIRKGGDRRINIAIEKS